MKIFNEVDNETVRKACTLVTQHYKDEAFLADVENNGPYKHTSDNGNAIANKIRGSDLTIYITPYKALLPWSKAVGYAEGNKIFVNTRKMDLSLNERIANIMHEAMHLLGYSHKGNRVTKYNLQTVPYKVGRLFAQHVTNHSERQ